MTIERLTQLQRHTEGRLGEDTGRMSCDNEGRDSNYAVVSQGVSVLLGIHQKLEQAKKPSFRFQGYQDPSEDLILDLKPPEL